MASFGWWSRAWWAALLERVTPWPATNGAPPPLATSWWPGTDGAASTYAQLYKTQPHVRTVIDFLSSQLGQLGLHVYRRVSDTDRVRVADHPLAVLLRRPNAGTTRYVWMTETIQDLCVFGNAYSVKLRRPNRLELYRVPPGLMRPSGDLIARAYTWTLPDGHTVTLPASEVFHLKEYNPDDPIVGLSRLETLRKLLAEETAAVTYREWFWANGAKLSGWIARPKDAPRWTQEQRKQFGEEWRQFQGPSNAGRTAILEDGMEFTPITATARDSELVDARKLSREEVAAAFHIPPAMLGIMEAQGYGSIREQHKALYQDALGPRVAHLEGEIERQLLVEFSDSDDIYVQANIAEKLQGSFEEEQNALSAAVGSPYMSRNEARARLNLPRINSAAFDAPVTRLDIAEGQMARAAGAAAPLPAASMFLVESAATAPPVDLDPLAERIERALRVLPAEIAARLPGALPSAALSAVPSAIPSAIRLALTDERGLVAVTRFRRDAQGHLAAFEDYAADGTLLQRRPVVRDAQGRVTAVAPAERP